jgi:hypothetical protein
MPDSVWRDTVASAGPPELTPHAEELTCVAAAVPTANGEPSDYALSISSSLTD